MKTHNAIIYHCVRCGSVVHREPEEACPSCCGQDMVKAAAETICDETGEVGRESSPTQQTPPVKPR